MDLINLVVAFLCIIFVLMGYNSMKTSGVKCYNLSFFFFFFCFLLNTTKLSIYQQDKTFDDIYYLIIGSLFFFFPIYFSEKCKIKKWKHGNLFNITKLYFVFLVVYIATKIYISTIVGWRINSFLTSTFLVNGDSLSVPGYTGLAAVLQWTLLMMTPLLPKKKMFLGVIFVLALIVFSFLHVKRGDIMRMSVFFLILYLYRSFQVSSIRKTNKKQMLKVGLILSLILFVFIQFGNIRQEARGEEKNELVQLLGLKYNNNALAWVYGYFAINYDVVRLYYDVKNNNKPDALKGIIGGEEDNPYNKSINGFNATTFLSPFIIDYGIWFFVELVIFTLIICFFLFFSKKLRHDSLYIFITSYVALFPFGNYFLSRAIFSSMILFIFISLLLKEDS